MSHQVVRAAHRLVRRLEQHSVPLLRVSPGIVFCWFGALKVFPGLCSAEGIAGRTMEALSFGWVQPDCSVPLLAVWECLIGIGLITGCCLRWALLLLFAQMFGTFTPLLLLPGEMVPRPFAPTLEAQYIIKNVVLMSAALVIATAHRAGKPAVGHANPAQGPHWRQGGRPGGAQERGPRVIPNARP
jgi:uncharacterized membrane protein YkgB